MSLNTNMQEFFDKNNFKKKFNVWEEIIKLPIGYIKLDIDFPADQFLGECLALKDKAKTFSFTRYQKFDKEEPGWTGLALAENEDVSFRSISYNHAPKLSAWFKECGFFNFSNPDKDKIHVHFLEPGATIPIHRDYEDNNLSGINFAVTQPQGCKFLVDEYGEIPFEKPGDVFLVQIGKDHSVYNNSDDLRIHILPKVPMNEQKIVERILL